MANTVTVKRWVDTPASCAAMFKTRDDAFGSHTLSKYVYGIYFTYKSSTTMVTNVALTYVKDGGTTFINTSLPAATLPVASTYDIAKIEFTSPVLCQSMRWRFKHTSGTFEIGDINVEFRPIYKRVS